MTSAAPLKTTALDMIINDHRTVDAMFQTYEADPHAADVQSLVRGIIIELVQHAEAEEQYLYPAARKVLANGDRVIEHDITEHTRAEQIMNSLDGMEPSHPEFDRLVRLLISEIRQHVSEEEGITLPQLRNALTEDDLVQLGGKLQQAKKIAPTHPHPSAPDHPPFNKVMGAGPALVDRVRDFLNGDPK